MFFPADMTAEDIEQFEYEYNRILDEERNEGQYWAVNAECQIVADLQQVDELVV
jgi:hypothetical protein